MGLQGLEYASVARHSICVRPNLSVDQVHAYAGVATQGAISNMKAVQLEGNDESSERVVEVSLTGKSLLEDPLLNKGSAFTEQERVEFGLLGLLPPHVSSVDEQLERTYHNFRQKTTDLEKYIFLISLQDRNETLFYRLLLAHIEEMTPIIYTPVVGLGCQEYSRIYRRPRGLYVSFPDRADLPAMLANS